MYPLSDLLTVTKEIWFIQEIFWVLLQKIIPSILSKTDQNERRGRTNIGLLLFS